MEIYGDSLMLCFRKRAGGVGNIGVADALARGDLFSEDPVQPQVWRRLSIWLRLSQKILVVARFGRPGNLMLGGVRIKKAE